MREVLSDHTHTDFSGPVGNLLENEYLLFRCGYDKKLLFSVDTISILVYTSILKIFYVAWTLKEQYYIEMFIALKSQKILKI